MSLVGQDGVHVELRRDKKAWHCHAHLIIIDIFDPELCLASLIRNLYELGQINALLQDWLLLSSQVDRHNLDLKRLLVRIQLEMHLLVVEIRVGAWNGA